VARVVTVLVVALVIGLLAAVAVSPRTGIVVGLVAMVALLPLVRASSQD